MLKTLFIDWNLEIINGMQAHFSPSKFPLAFKAAIEHNSQSEVVIWITTESLLMCDKSCGNFKIIHCLW